MKSPFQFGKIVTDDFFINREKERKRLTSNFSHNIHTILISPRRWGKSSLVKKVQEDLSKNKKIKFCCIDMFNIRTEEDFYAAYAKEVIKVTSNKIEEWVKIAGSFLSKIYPKITIGENPANEFSISFELNELEGKKEEILNLPERIAASKNIQIVICLDEFQNMSNFKDPLQFQKSLRSFWQHHKFVTYCLYGSKKNMLMHLFEDKSMPFYKFGEIIYLEKIEKSPLVQFIIDAFKRTKKIITPTIAETIVEYMQCHPYYIQQLAHLVWVNSGKRVSEEDIQSSLEDLINQNSIFFQKEIDDLSNTQINLLKAVAKGVNEFLSSKAIMDKFKLGTSANVIKIKDVLIKKEIIDVINKKIVFLDPAFELWFKTNYLKETDKWNVYKK